MPKAKSKETQTPSSTRTSLPYHYLYSDSNILKNKYRIKNLDVFLKKCSHDTTKAMVNLCQASLPEKLDSSYLRDLHQQLFQNTFEWAETTRDTAFKFEDGTTAVMPEMKRTGWKNPFSIDDEIQKGLQKLDRTLAEKNNLQGLSREAFICESVEIFISFNHTHPFIEGNERTQRLFFQQFEQIAGHQLDFLLVTKERMLVASLAAAQDSQSRAYETSV
ncbi:hypothetical protein Q649_01347 [Bartonella quintana JK 73]|uniref:protein adenylyltransferase n=1 Tax=Bartonella quintana JK 73 TaxID=1402976 RepID=W3TX67_BARQI|nr:hypothetical protein Q650_01345 [Bartonella quintana JK 73rel]ETS15128.1 hypothetical protein Q649_01347 [Bartonella quintana JK 73]